MHGIVTSFCNITRQNIHWHTGLSKSALLCFRIWFDGAPRHGQGAAEATPSRQGPTVARVCWWRHCYAAYLVWPLGVTSAASLETYPYSKMLQRLGQKEEDGAQDRALDGEYIGKYFIFHSFWGSRGLWGGDFTMACPVVFWYTKVIHFCANHIFSKHNNLLLCCHF